MKKMLLFLLLISFVGSLFAQTPNPPNIIADSSGYSVYHYTNSTLSGISNYFYMKNAGGSGVINITVKVDTFTENKQFTVNSNAGYKLISDIPAKDNGYNSTLNISASFDPGITLSTKISAHSSVSPGPVPITIWHNVFPKGASTSTLEELSPSLSISDNLLMHLSLSQNYPNPFNQTTTISFSVPSISFVSLRILDLTGKEIATIVSEKLPAGVYSRQWNAGKISSGIYFYRLQEGLFVETKKINLIR